MAVSKIVVSVLLVIFAMAFFTVQAQEFAPAPAPAPTSDGVSVDQGIAYVLMLVALVLTYLIHPMDASSYNFF
ncbi:arabinogalactan protein 16-like [Lycium barbarum]|uniref:arabinogalactan protein 16-like n=1 Tax=Lycium barbarum TaxID=112863 RepID=UPI00293F5D65|nr:arabinogalactan protein 16-like [Lycium barbarum]